MKCDFNNRTVDQFTAVDNKLLLRSSIHGCKGISTRQCETDILDTIGYTYNYKLWTQSYVAVNNLNLLKGQTKTKMIIKIKQCTQLLHS